ncbi:MAG TPA: fibrobacter succinogenes major paralogous domain-containing protein, partial [Algoriphagus sp.]|nr:fibrobacter succinogenes major paralogous domain-containing protein [Algoriphagus sp.]
KIGGETRIWEVWIQNEGNVIPDVDDFWKRYFEGSEVIFDSLTNLPELDYYTEEALLWSKFFQAQLSTLTQSEKNELVYILSRSSLSSLEYFSFEPWMEYGNCLNANYSIYSRNSDDGGEYQREKAGKFLYLPSSKIVDGFLSALGDMIWRHHAVVDISAKKMLECPILRDIRLETSSGIVTEQPFAFDSGDSLAFTLTGIYSTLNASDQGLRSDSQWIGLNIFEELKAQRKAHSEWIFSLIHRKDLDLPPLPVNPHYLLPEKVEIVERPLMDYQFEVKMDSNPFIILSQPGKQENRLFLTFENKNIENQHFQFAITFNHDGFLIEKRLNGVIHGNSDLILDLWFERGTAKLDIISGSPPYDIFWSNGVKNETQVKFDAGNHSVQVKDGKGKEKLMEFMIPEFGTVEDREGNEYETVKIGDRWWMAENLRNTIRKDGRPVLERANWPSWNPSMPPEYDYASFSYYMNDPDNEIRYGNLYNIHAIFGCLCPEGWEVPFVKDFVEMGQELGGAYLAGPKLKSRDSWNEPPYFSTNEAGFNAKPGGMKFQSYSYKDEGIFTGWWARNENHPDYLPNFIAYLDFGNNQLKTMIRDVFYFEGHYVRCIKKE